MNGRKMGAGRPVSKSESSCPLPMTAAERIIGHQRLDEVDRRSRAQTPPKLQAPKTLTDRRIGFTFMFRSGKDAPAFFQPIQEQADVEPQNSRAEPFRRT